MGEPVYRDYDQAALDAQYNLRALVPEHPAHFERWARDSAAARERLHGLLDVAYAEGPAATLDFFPAPELGAPILAFIHGGYWQALDKSDFSYLAPAWVDAGISFVSVNYALAPDASIARMVEQCRQAMLWLWSNAHQLGAESSRILVAGHSAGGHLAAMVLATDWGGRGGLASGLVKGACAVSGLYDLEPVRLTYLNEVLRLDRAAAAGLSPVRQPAPPAGRAPLLLAVGAKETQEFQRQQAAFATQRRAKDLPVEAILLDGRNHFEAVDALAEPAGVLFRALRAMIGA